jgi:hypothetical protein
MDWSRSRKKRQNSNSFGFELKIPNNPYLNYLWPGPSFTGIPSAHLSRPDGVEL